MEKEINKSTEIIEVFDADDNFLGYVEIDKKYSVREIKKILDKKFPLIWESYGIKSE